MDKELAPYAPLSHYRIISKIGAGGMGEVYLAEDTLLRRKVAIKLLPARFADHPDRLKRFEQEARAASGLNHPNILTIHEFGTENGSPFIVMEFVEGLTLREKAGAGILSINETIEIATQVASALSAAHEAGIIHRDIKPENIMIRHDGFVKVLDFGLAKLTERYKETYKPDSSAPTGQQHETNPGLMLGTTRYMSPEQIRGKEIDSRSDIFSFGIVLYEMLAGHKPFVGDSNVEVMSAILREEPQEISETNSKITPALQRVVRCCLEKRPERRFHSAHDLGFALEALSTSSSSQPGGMLGFPVLTAPRAARARSERVAWCLAAAFAILAIASLLLAVHQRGERKPQRDFRPLNLRREAVFQACFGPDGKTVVYSSATDGNNPELWTVDPAFPAPHLLGAPGMHLLGISSKDELAILVNARYVRHRTFIGTLARMPLTGGGPREIQEGVRHAAWSPDGVQLAIIREVDGRDRLEYPIGKVLHEVSGYMSDLRFSPDGGRIAFFEHPRKGDDSGAVSVIDLHGKKTVLTDGYWSARGLAWSPDGKEVLFSASTTGGAYTIFAVTLGGAVRLADRSPGGLILQDIAGDGRWLVSRLDFRYGAMVHTPSNREDRDLSWLRTSHAKALSQDGQSLLFMETSVAKNYAVCLRKTDGSPVVQLGEGTPMDLSSDAQWVLAVLPSSPPQLVVYPTGAGETRHLDRANIANYASAQWFRDGRRILIGGNEPGKRTRFYVQNLDGGLPEPVTPEGYRDGRLSPDGKLILAQGPGGKYFLVPVGGGEPRPAPGLTETDVVIQWSADGRSWFTYQGSAIPCRVERVDLDTGKRGLFKEIAPPNRSGLLAVRPNFITDDQQSYTYTIYEQVSSLFVSSEGDQ